MSETERTRPVEGLASVSEERAALVPTGTASSTSSAPPVDAWAASESWPKSLWRAAKATVIGGVTFYSLMRLMDDQVSIRGSAFMAIWSGFASLSTSRTGSMTPAMPSLIMGGVSVGSGLIAGAVALVTGAGAGAAAQIALTLVFLGSVMLFMGFKARRAERALAAGKSSERVAPTLIPRAELASRLERLQEDQAPEARRILKRVLIGGGVLMSALAFPYTRVFGAEPPDVVWMGVLFGGWGAAGLLARTAARRGREMAEKFGLVCSACDKTYFGAFANHRFQKNIVEIGRCPQCGVRIVTEDGR